jgi:hypothetical protein
MAARKIVLPSALKEKIRILKHLHKISLSVLFVVVKNYPIKWIKEVETPKYPSLVLSYASTRCFFSPANFRHSDSVSNGELCMCVLQLKNRSEIIDIVSRRLNVVRQFRGKRGDKEIQKEKKMKLLIRQFSCGFVEDNESWTPVLINSRGWTDENSSSSNSEMKM